ncbi:MAG: CNP1-like family protein [Pseudomonadota bacterium]
MKKLPVLLLCLPAFSQAAWIDFEREFEEEKPWVEVAAQLPPYPKSENLLPFTVSSATRNRYFLDAASITVGEDKVVRYIVVIEAAGGARNVSFEGMRCETVERRLYAYGQPDGTWSKARNAGWEAIKLRSLLSHHKALYEDLLCPDGINVQTPAEALRALKQGGR